MREMTVTELRQQLLDVIRQVEQQGVEFTVVRHGRRVARIVPERPEPASLRGIDAGHVTIVDPDDDLFSTGERWDLE